jgi:hypothetical protein
MNRFVQIARGWGRSLPIAAACSAILATGAVVGCDSAVLVASEPKSSSTTIEPFMQSSSVDKVDLLLMLDNSRSMADKQLILAASVPDLVGSLVNPPCLDSNKVPAPPPMQPKGPLENCPAGTRRAIRPITDIHIGVITSSLGGHGSDACGTAEIQSCGGAANPSNNDAGHLVSRQDACGGESVPTYQSQGFLAWDPAQELSPPGIQALGSIAVDAGGVATTVTPGLYPALKDLVLGVGQVGCGYESQLESWYRFLVDPEPYQTIGLQDGKATPEGTDTLLLKARADFLRPSSLLAIVMLTDENDCSVKESGQSYLALQQQNPQDAQKKFHLPRARQECAQDPQDPCCKSCGQEANGCPVDVQCQTSPTLNDAEDDINLRCFDQKRRFGIDFLYPTDRYTSALRSAMVPNRQGDMVQNPIFSDLNPNDEDTDVRDPSLVLLIGVVGVPWQAIARTDENGNPDLVRGFKSTDELSVKDETGLSAWDRVLGDPDNHVPPLDPRMIESMSPRAGLPGPASAPGTDPVNGHEYTTSNADLQYACIFDLPAPRDCAVTGINGCDCALVGNDNPLCDATTKTLQVRAKAYPGLRELSVLRSLGANGVVASVCPVQLSDLTAPTYGYRAALGAVVDRLTPTISAKCLERHLTPDATGRVSCTIVEARNAKNACSCDPARARRPLKTEHQGFIAEIKASPEATYAAWDCFCELIQAGDPADSSPEELAACIGDPSDFPIIQGGEDAGRAATGWCYVDPSESAAASDEIVKECPVNEKRILRFAGGSAENGKAMLFISCAGE